MTIQLEHIGKKFRNEWIFRNLNYEFISGKSYAITGSNGSGKSTLLQVISGSLPANEGKVSYHRHHSVLETDNWYKEMAIAAPYMEVIEELTLDESIDFHCNFKKLSFGLNKEEFLEKVYLKPHRHKSLKQFSSGMKQRFKLGLAFFTESSVLFLDEPTTNLDQTGIDWYLNQVAEIKKYKLVLISSNDKKEYQFCDEVLDIMSYK